MDWDVVLDACNDSPEAVGVVMGSESTNPEHGSGWCQTTAASVHGAPLYPLQTRRPMKRKIQDIHERSHIPLVDGVQGQDAMATHTIRVELRRECRVCGGGLDEIVLRSLM